MYFQVSVTNSKRKQKALSTTSIDECMKAKCCKANCIKKILTREDVVKSRKQYRELSEEGQRNFLLNFYVNNQHYYNGKRQYKFLVNCKTVCRTAWMKAYSISPNKLLHPKYFPRPLEVKIHYFISTFFRTKPTISYEHI